MKVFERPYCPVCGTKAVRNHAERRFACDACGFEYYQNIAAATVVLLRWRDELLLTVRAREPHKGKLDLPGGFCEIGETFEAGAIREIEEELGLKLEGVRYRFSFPNIYPYGGVVYHSCDTYFEVWFDEKPMIQPADDVADARWMAIDAIDPALLAFDAMRSAIKQLRAEDSAPASQQRHH